MDEKKEQTEIKKLKTRAEFLLVKKDIEIKRLKRQLQIAEEILFFIRRMENQINGRARDWFVGQQAVEQACKYFLEKHILYKELAHKEFIEERDRYIATNKRRKKERNQPKVESDIWTEEKEDDYGESD